MVEEGKPPRCIVVGVTAQQPEAVLRQAARFARRFDATVVCAHVDPASYVVVEHPDGSVEARPIDPDLPDWVSSPFDDELASRIRGVADEDNVAVVFRELAGDVAHALGRLAEILQAEMIVVGSRRRGVRSSLQEFFGGSVAAHLAHRQRRPVVVIPLAPVRAGSRLPWEDAGS
ncbi:MAG TPA: universal stress protein [Propionibacteriaceae bacterium]|nr:universal stress protein [Propionibacteriaceae bacterium]